MMKRHWIDITLIVIAVLPWVLILVVGLMR